MNSPITSGLRSASGFHYQNKRAAPLPSLSERVRLLNFRGGRFYLDLEPRDWSLSCPVEGIKLVVATSKIILPYQPGCVANKEADKRRKETKQRLSARTRICRTATAAVNRAGAA